VTARLPRAAWIVLVVGFVNAAIWTALIPPFQVPDETDHFAYAQYLAETGKPPPQGPQPSLSPQESTALNGLFFYDVIGHPAERGVTTPGEDANLRRALAGANPRGAGGLDSVSNQPPLYYALAAIPYRLSPSGDILTRLELMRLVSALLAGLTVLAVFLFLREVFPALPWAWSVGSLVVAFQPQFDFIAAGVHSDSLLFLVSAATFLALARAHRRGLTPRRGALIGAAAAIGLLGKLTFVALVPGIALALVLLVWGARGDARRPAGLGAAVAVAVAAVPVAVYGILNATVWHRGGPTAGGFVGAATGPLPGHRVISLPETLDYTWQLYLPKLPFMNHVYFPAPPLREYFFNGAIGHFGWLDYGFAPRVYQLAWDGCLVLVALALVGLWRARRELSGLGRPALAFAVMAVGLLGAIGYDGIRYRTSTGFVFEQARYLFPLLPLYAVFLVLAARAAPRRWAPALGAALVVLAMAHGLFAMLLTVSRYYG
jgi:4-amino-4-deoxy-L-arabinose transferase-like glycosyltransferase